MLEPDRNVPTQAQAVADFFKKNGVTMVSMRDDSPVTAYHFFVEVDDVDSPFSCGVLEFDTQSGAVIEPSDEELARRTLPGLPAMMDSFGVLLVQEKGDSESPVFEPIHAVNAF